MSAAPGTRSTTAPVDDRVLHLGIRVAADADAAFRHFTENALLERWLTTRADVEPVVGGSYQLYWVPDDPENNSTIGCRVTACAPPRLIAFQWRSPAQYKALANGADPLTHVVVTCVPDPAGTAIHLVHSGWGSSEEWLAAADWQQTAWRMAFEQLAELLGSPA